MTDFQFKAILQMVLKILDHCKDLEEAKQEIKDLIEKADKKI